MRMIVCVLQDSDKDNVVRGLNDEDFHVTVLPSTGGYFRRGNTTLFIGTDDDRVERAIQIIKQNSKQSDDQGRKRATVFVLKVDQYEKI